MTQAVRDLNFRPVLLGQANNAGKAPMPFLIDPITGRLLVDVSGVAGTGDVVGPASSVDNAIARYDSTTGKLLQDSLATVDDSGSINIPTGQTYKINGAALTTANIAEGANLYFTNERVDDRINALFVAGTNITLTYDDVANTFTVDAAGGGGSIDGSGTADRIAYWSDADTIAADSLLYWDPTNNKMGIGTANPNETLHVVGNFIVTDNDTETKSYRFRTNGSSLDLDFGGENLYFSGFPNADFSGTQNTLFIMGKDGYIDWLAPHFIKGNQTINSDKGSAVVWRIHGDTIDDILYADTANNRIGVRTSSPDEAFDVNGSIRGNVFIPIVTAVAAAAFDATETIDWSAGQTWRGIADIDCTFTFSNPADGATYKVVIEYSSTTARVFTWPATVRWAGGVTPTPTGEDDKVDVFTFVYDGTSGKYYGVASQNFSIA